jgi:hypothetical protein
MRQVQAERFAKANPRLKINTKVVGTVDPPIAEFEFVDGTVVSITDKMIMCLLLYLSSR